MNEPAHAGVFGDGFIGRWVDGVDYGTGMFDGGGFEWRLGFRRILGFGVCGGGIGSVGGEAGAFWFGLFWVFRQFFF